MPFEFDSDYSAYTVREALDSNVMEVSNHNVPTYVANLNWNS